MVEILEAIVPCSWQQCEQQVVFFSRLARVLLFVPVLRLFTETATATTH
jgi:hypothetical protein